MCLSLGVGEHTEPPRQSWLLVALSNVTARQQGGRGRLEIILDVRFGIVAALLMQPGE